MLVRIEYMLLHMEQRPGVYLQWIVKMKSIQAKDNKRSTVGGSMASKNYPRTHCQFVNCQVEMLGGTCPENGQPKDAEKDC